MDICYALHLDGGQDVLAGDPRSGFTLPTFSRDQVTFALVCADLLKAAAPEALVTIVLWPDDDPEAPVVRTPEEVLRCASSLSGLTRALEGERAAS